MKGPKKVVISEDGYTVVVGDKEFDVDKLDATAIALIMKERSRGYIKTKKDKLGKIKVYAQASTKACLLGVGMWLLSKCFQSADVVETILRSAWLALGTGGLALFVKSRVEAGKLKKESKNYAGDQLFFAAELGYREMHGEDTKLAEEILKEAVEECDKELDEMEGK